MFFVSLFLFPFLSSSTIHEVNCAEYNGTCDYKCFTPDTDNSNVRVYCLTSTEVSFCAEPRPYFFIILICPWIPTLIGLIMRFTCIKNMKPPICSYIYDIFTTFFIVAFVEGIYCLTLTNDLLPINFPILGIGFIGLPIIMCSCLCAETKCCCHDPETYPHYIRRFLKEKVYQRAAGETIITEARQNPPTIQLIGNQHVYHRRNKHSWVEIIPVEHDTLPYQTWEERGELVTIPNSPVVSIRMAVEIYKSAELQEVQKEKWLTIENALKPRNYYKYSIEESDFVDRYVEAFLISRSDEIPCCVTFSNSCFGRFIYYFLHVIGFHSLFETIWCLYVDMIYVKLEKYIDEGDQYRARAGEKDDKALTYQYEQPSQV